MSRLPIAIVAVALLTRPIHGQAPDPAKEAERAQGLVAAGDKQAEETLREKSRPQAEKDVRLSYLFKSIAAQEKLEATHEDVDVLKKKALEETKDNPTQVDKYFLERDLAIRASLTEGKVLEFLKNNAKIKAAKE